MIKILIMYKNNMSEKTICQYVDTHLLEVDEDIYRPASRYISFQEMAYFCKFSDFFCYFISF